jgi:hypothetical protein
MNRKLKQVTARESRASKLLSQGSSSSSSRQEAMLRCVHGEEEQRGEEEQGGEEEWRGEEQGGEEEQHGEEEEAELEHLLR